MRETPRCPGETSRRRSRASTRSMSTATGPASPPGRRGPAWTIPPGPAPGPAPTPPRRSRRPSPDAVCYACRLSVLLTLSVFDHGAVPLSSTFVHCASMVGSAPERTREYRNHHLDSTRWDRVVPRDDDIVITTAYKAGTTWMQRIVAALVFGPGPVDMMGVSPWIDARWLGPVEPVLAQIESQRHRRFMKSHLAADGLRYFPQAKYLVVGRDTRDVFMSLWNHYSSYTDLTYQLLNDPERPGPEFPRCPATPAELWPRWITEGWFEWEPDGWPFWSHHHHMATWWSVRDAAEHHVRALRRPPRRHRGGDATRRRLPRHRGRGGNVARARRGRRYRCDARGGRRGRRSAVDDLRGRHRRGSSTRAPTAAGATRSPTTISRCTTGPHRHSTRPSAPGSRVAVTPSASDTEPNADRVVDKEELLAAMLQTRFVTESALTSRIRAAPRAIGDDGRAQHAIRTTHGAWVRVRLLP